MCRQSVWTLHYVIHTLETSIGKHINDLFKSANDKHFLPNLYKKMEQNCKCIENIRKDLLEEERKNL